jgi:UDP-N-acetylglucosamine--N-acetylmuramyl-(pentapeptide) pyrophosphoryl-undecaprenol N-acetylglucosamine transferase
MKIALTGGGTGGHFYPLIAVVEQLREYAKENHLIEPTLYYLSSDPYDARLLFDYHIAYRRVPAGRRSSASPMETFRAGIVTAIGAFKALINLFIIFPDVVFSKGGFDSVPTVLAARFLGIPIVIHESDSIPGRANVWAARFADKIAVSYPSAIDALPERLREKAAWTGNPVRREISIPNKSGAHEFLDLETEIPSILVLGGSQGALRINESIVDALPRLLSRVQVIHQTGKTHFEVIKGMADVAIQDPILRKRYRPMAYLNDVALTMAAGAASVVVTRAGSTLFEIAQWGVPAIVIPIRDSASDHQRKNAFAYARAGAGVVIEENNLSDLVVVNEILRIIDEPATAQAMAAAALKFARPDAARAIAKELVAIAITHE